MAAEGTKSFEVYGRARIREKSVRVYVGSFASQKQAEAADEQHRVTQRAINAGDLPAAFDHKRSLGDALDAWLRAIKTSARTTSTRAGCGSTSGRRSTHAAREDHKGEADRSAHVTEGA